MRQQSENPGYAFVPVKNAEATAHAQFVQSALLSFLLITAFVFLPTTAFAAPVAATDPLSLTICTVVKWFTGSLGKTIATLGIVVLGIGALMGKISWGMALTVAIGTSIMFSGAKVVSMLTGNSAHSGVCAMAADTTPQAIVDVLCNLGALASQSTGRAFGTFAVAMLGVGALFAKISYTQALVSGAGIALFFKAESFVNLLFESSAAAYQCSPASAS